MVANLVASQVVGTDYTFEAVGTRCVPAVCFFSERSGW